MLFIWLDSTCHIGSLINISLFDKFLKSKVFYASNNSEKNRKTCQIEVFNSRYQKVFSSLSFDEFLFFKFAARFSVELSPVSAQNSAAFLYKSQVQFFHFVYDEGIIIRNNINNYILYIIYIMYIIYI